MFKRTFQKTAGSLFYQPQRAILQKLKSPAPVLTGNAKHISWLKLFGGVMAFNTATFGLARYKDDFGIVDITWGLMFLIPNSILLFNRR
jgi:hypothetical protein